MKRIFVGHTVVALALACAAALPSAVTAQETGRVTDNRESCSDCGTVRAIKPVQGGGKASGAGAVIGAVIGGVVGHQFGSGKGKDAATAAGAVGGGVAGHQAEKRRNTGGPSVHEVTVRMDDSSTRVVTVASAESVSVGSRVRVVGNNLELR